MTVHVVVGAGEVGQAVAAALARGQSVVLRDVDPVECQADVLHVCFPWGPSFVAAVEGYAVEHSAGLVIVHSTVPVGTCDPHGWVHSPVRGSHPRLVDGITTFAKHFGGARALDAARVFEQIGVHAVQHERAADCEAGKLWELIQFGVQIHVEKAIHQWCDDNGLDFDVVYTRMGQTYNDGWSRLGHNEFVRPILRHVPGPIGGHCVVENAGLIDHPLANMVARVEVDA